MSSIVIKYRCWGVIAEAETKELTPPPPLPASQIKPNFHTFPVMCMKGFSYLPEFHTFSVSFCEFLVRMYNYNIDLKFVLCSLTT